MIIDKTNEELMILMWEVMKKAKQEEQVIFLTSLDCPICRKLLVYQLGTETCDSLSTDIKMFQMATLLFLSFRL